MGQAEYEDLNDGLAHGRILDVREGLRSSEIVCYGLLSKADTLSLNIESDQVELDWDGRDQPILDNGDTITFSPRMSNILSNLSQEGGTTFTLKIETLDLSHRTDRGRKADLDDGMVKKSVSIFVYGPIHEADDIGLWLDEIDLHLQMPIGCSRDIPYYNPHAMTPPTKAVVMTSELQAGVKAENSNTLKTDAVFDLDAINKRVYPEAKQPSLIKSQLHSHQLQALSFLQGRELGWDLQNERGTNDVWQQKLDSLGREIYLLILSHESSFKPPAEFRGGILADEMGLGKTCTMLALVASDHTAPAPQGKIACTHVPTLIVVPLPLLQVWEKQIKEHIINGKIGCTTYYGPTRDYAQISSCDVVLTTYNVIAKEWRSLQKITSAEKAPVLYTTHWHRIVLDEAHIVRNRHTAVARAVSALHGDRRWCITGTPIQNRSSDIYGLLRFLKVYPYDNFRTFETTFIEPWIACADESALMKLQILISSITIRRSRATICLPPREEFMSFVQFSSKELEVYAAAKNRAFESIDDAIASEAVGASGASYLNALQKINDLRYICNHGTQPRSRKVHAIHLAEAGKNSVFDGSVDVAVTESIISYTACTSCGFDPGDACLEDDDPSGVNDFGIPNIAGTACSACGVDRLTMQPISSKISPSSSPHASSKIQTLLQKVQQTGLHDKCVVFSYWTSTLKVIGQALTQIGVGFLLYDGSLTRARRDRILGKFASDHSIKVLLLSITCGGQGLDLTVANHAFVFEPQWNPMLEEQAMARVHRLGQTKAVQLTRLIVKNTWEEKIVTLQKQKRFLADLIVDSKRIDKSHEMKQQLLWLRETLL